MAGNAMPGRKTSGSYLGVARPRTVCGTAFGPGWAVYATGQGKKPWVGQGRPGERNFPQAPILFLGVGGGWTEAMDCVAGVFCDHDGFPRVHGNFP